MKAIVDSQFLAFKQDVKLMISGSRVRVFSILFQRAFWGLLVYRFERGLYVFFGERYRFMRIPIAPFLNLLQQLSNIEIPYRANIQGGLQILHPSLGIVISQYAEIGKNVVLYGGNVIGTKNLRVPGLIKMGDHCIVGANAVILGPLEIVDSVKIGALSCVIKSCFTEGATLVGSPARVVDKGSC